MADRADVAASFHARQCEDPRFGYTQGGGRWGGSEIEWWEAAGVSAPFAVGDRDCSSSVIDCWREALRGSAYEGSLDGATYTGNMRSVFTASGLFEWHPMGDGYVAQRGDIYLNEASHTAMCQSAVPDMLSEFSINELGTITGGQVGDQTGSESRIGAYYDFPWDGILSYNHQADEEDDMFTDEDRAKLDALYTLIFDDSDPTGRDKPGNIVFKGKWMAAKQEQGLEMLEEIKDAVTDSDAVGGTD